MADESSGGPAGNEGDVDDALDADDDTPNDDTPNDDALDSDDALDAAPDDDAPDDALDADALDEASQTLRDARARLAEVPAELVVTNHVMGLYELAAIHLSADPPDLRAAALAIDAVACLVEGLGERLGADIATMRDALANIRLAFVQVKGAAVQHRPAEA